MDANLIGLLLLLVLLGRGGWDSFDRRRQRQTARAADQQRWAGLELKLEGLMATLEKDYLRRDAHMREHEALNKAVDSLRQEVRTQGRELQALRGGKRHEL